MDRFNHPSSTILSTFPRTLIKTSYYYIRSKSLIALYSTQQEHPQVSSSPPWRTTPKIDQFWGLFFRGGPLPSGSWLGNHPTPPGGGGFLRSIFFCFVTIFQTLWYWNQAAWARELQLHCTAHFSYFRNHISAKDLHTSANDRPSDTRVKQQECAVHCTQRRRLIGCLKLQVVFCKRATDYRALLQKTNCKDNASYGTKPPCTGVQQQECAVHGKSWAMCHVSQVMTHRVRL